MSRTLRELREAKGLTPETLATRINVAIKDWMTEALRQQGMDMRGSWPMRDVLLERHQVKPETVARWEKVGFGVQVLTRAAHAFYHSPAFIALVKILEADPSDMEKEISNSTLQPGDTVVRSTARFLVVPDGFSGTFLKEERHVTDADHEAINTYLEDEEAFLEAERAKAIEDIVRAALVNLDGEINRLLEE